MEKKNFVKVSVENFKSAIVPWNELKQICQSNITETLLADGKIISLSRVEMTDEEFEALEEFKGY